MKRNISKLQERMKKLQRQMKEYERLYYVELGKAVEQWFLNSDSVEVLKEKIEKIKKDFGR
ncbi:hypothetical protein [Thermodesulfovibrio sp. 1176]|uniref:hypothetical protein n=1 Tax=unclassified Thermodesulfovibrio TaxID=2645936 RepID=UPI0024832882|nr:hypothetical protein [Thermodesulfovibrio sp. 1176]MDI1471543.1 hypothetical protein [Thermodesulfovibrio sp. 1176]